MTISEIADKAFELLGDGSRNYWGQQEVEALVKSGVRELAKAGVFARRFNVQLLESQNEYALPDGVIEIKYVSDSDGRVWDVLPFSPENADRDYAILIDNTSTFYVPKPIDTTLTFYVYENPVITNDIPSKDVDVEDALKYYAAYKAFILDDEASNMQKAAVYKQMYEEAMKSIKDRAFRGYSSKVKHTEFRGF